MEWPLEDNVKPMIPSPICFWVRASMYREQFELAWRQPSFNSESSFDTAEKIPGNVSFTTGPSFWGDALATALTSWTAVIFRSSGMEDPHDGEMYSFRTLLKMLGGEVGMNWAMQFVSERIFSLSHLHIVIIARFLTATRLCFKSWVNTTTGCGSSFAISSGARVFRIDKMVSPSSIASGGVDGWHRSSDLVASK